MPRANFCGHEPARDDGLRQIPWSPIPADAAARINRDIEKHLAKRNRLDEERALQGALYRGAAG